MTIPPRVTLAQIAAYAQVRRPSVSNWRRRHADFPAAVNDGATPPEFDTQEVAKWLDRRSIPHPRDEEATTYGDLFRTNLLLNAVTSLSLPVEQIAEEALRAIAGETSGTAPEVVEAVGPLVERLGTADAAERVLSSVARMGARWAPLETPPCVGALVAALHQALVDGVTGQTVLALHAGTGGMLATLLATGSPLAATAVVPDARLRELLRLRLACHGLSATVHDSIETADLREVDTVVVDPPFQPSEHSDSIDHPLVWAERAVEHLSVDGLAYMVVPEWTLTRTGRGSIPPTARVRDRLLRQRCVRKIIQLPRRVHPHRPGAELVLLVLGAPGSAGGTVVLCDAARIAELQGRKGGGFRERARVAPWVEETVALVCAAHTAPPRPELCRAVAVRELLDGKSVLPSRRLSPRLPPSEHADRLAGARRAATLALADSSGPARTWLDRLQVVERRSPAPLEYVRLDQLLGSGQLRLLPGHRIEERDLGADGQPVYGREELLGEREVGERRIDPIRLADYPAALLTEPGDVVVLFEERMRAVVDDVGGSLLLWPVQGLRITAYRKLRGPTAKQLNWGEDLRVRPHQLAAMLRGGRNVRRGRGALARRPDLEGVELPVLSPQEAKLFDEAMAEHARQVDRLRRQLAALEKLGEALASGVADGALSVRLSPRAPILNTSSP